MSVGVWEAGKLYAPGAVVQPVSAPAPVSAAIVNPGFESGAGGWDFSGGAAYSATGGFTGPAACRVTGSVGSAVATAGIAVTPGVTITASCMGKLVAGSDGVSFDCKLVWYDAADSQISVTEGTELRRQQGSDWRKSTVTGTAPAGAAYVRIGADGNTNTGGDIYLDDFAWNYVPAVGSGGLIYKAVQANVGASGVSEPTWPTTVGVTVVDNEVTWECMAGTVVEWEANPIMESGGSEPTWPLVPGGSVVDGSVIWRAVTRHIEDENCPNTKQVAIAESHVFAADDDIVRFCAVINPQDWTTRGDAGFLPVGLQQSNSNGIQVLALYRKKLVPMNSSTTQLWAIDPDPELMVPIDQLDGAGSIHYRAAVAVADDLYYLAALGVRTVGMSGASRNLSAGDVGEPVDELIRPEITAAEDAGIDPHGYYFPGLGQYMLAFPQEAPTPEYSEVTLWGTTFSGGGPAIDSTEAFNDELDGATSVSIDAYWTDTYLYDYPPETDPLTVDPSEYGTFTALDTAIVLTTDTGAGSSVWALGENAAELPSGQILVILNIDGTLYLAAINNTFGE